MITKDNATIVVGFSPAFTREGNPIYLDLTRFDTAYTSWLTPTEALALAEELTIMAHKAAKEMETKA